MNTFFALVAALLPAFALLVYIWFRDPNKEPAGQLVRAFLWGVVICMPVAFAELFVQQLLFGSGDNMASLWDSTIMAFCVAAIPEETAKLLALWIVLFHNPHFDEHFDGIVYAVFISLGFAAVENVLYVLGQENWFSTAFVRALLAVPGHYAFGVIMGYYYALYHFVEHSRKNAIYMLLMPVLAHGTYDAIAMSASVNPIAGSIAFVVLIFFCIKMHKFAAEKIRHLLQVNK